MNPYIWTQDRIKNGMAYQIFSVNPLRGLTDAASARLQTLSSDLSLVRGLSVLDVGCFGGMASLCALDNGASEILSVDVDPTFLADIYAYYIDNKLPGRVLQSNFFDISDNESKDVVLLLEVYHWLSHQGHGPAEVAAKLNSLAKSLILIETPLDRTDPSVARTFKSKEQAQQYRLNFLLDELIKLDWNILYLGTAGYFREDYNRVRLLCSRKLPTP